VQIGGRDVTNLPPGRRDVAMVFQDYALFPHMTVQDNIAYPLRIKKVSRTLRHAKAGETADELGLSTLLQRRPGQLSGGQQQRVALARAMACHPQVFLLDEPLSNLDARLRLEARTFLKRLLRELGVTTVFVTHDQAEALALADRIAVMEGGRIRQVGTPTGCSAPGQHLRRRFHRLDPMNLVDARVHGTNWTWRGTPAGAWDARGQVADRGDRGVRRREYLTTPEPVPALSAVVVVENLGSFSLVSLDLPTGDAGADGAAGAARTAGKSVQVVVPEGREPEPGDTGWVVPRAGRSLLYRDGELLTALAAPTVPEPRTGVGAER
jgi:multiple sugar transport system ATP-binding protein